MDNGVYHAAAIDHSAAPHHLIALSPSLSHQVSLSFMAAGLFIVLSAVSTALVVVIDLVVVVTAAAVVVDMFLPFLLF